ncbi:MAG: hypothetical protein IIB17_04400 [Chloroflexi bacterium]|nr:hypothetical protein [Chloroflexota bacterium]
MATSTSTQHLLVDPTTSPIVPSFVSAPRLSSLTDKRIGLIDDAKENARELLEEIAELLKERFGVASVSYHRKPSASKPADPDVIEAMASDCDYVIVAIGS